MTDPHPRTLRTGIPDFEPSADAPFEHDTLRRHEFVQPLANLLRRTATPASIGVEGAWGSGKSKALKMLARHIEAHGDPVVWIDAWATEYAAEPLVPILSGMIDALEEYKGTVEAKDRERLGARITRLAMTSSRVIAAMAVQTIDGVATHLTGINPEDVAEAGVDALEARRGGELLAEFRETQSAISDVKTELEAALAARAEGAPPLVLIIDELDRCRPHYAVAFLERIQHIIGVPGVVTVFGIERNQLEASVRCLYGDIDAEAYLSRMLPVSFPLGRSEGEFIIHALHSIGADGLMGGLLVGDANALAARASVKLLCEQLELSLREMGVLAAQLARLGDTSRVSVDDLGFFVAAASLCAVRVRHRAIGDKMFSGEWDLSEFVQWFVQLDPRASGLRGEAMETLVRSLRLHVLGGTAESLSPVIREFQLSLDAEEIGLISRGNRDFRRTRRELATLMDLRYPF